MLPAFSRTALLLDLDGTLLDIAPTPDSVVVPPGLTDTLRTLRDSLNGGLAIVTGRAIAVVDGFLKMPLAISGEHGGALRASPGGAVERPNLPSPPPEWLARAEALATAYPGALLERKARGFALHFRWRRRPGRCFRRNWRRWWQRHRGSTCYRA